jgi:predicted enzyme related to lactoylglutathione lyase
MKVHIMVNSVEDTIANIVVKGGQVAMPFLSLGDGGQGYALFDSQTEFG